MSIAIIIIMIPILMTSAVNRERGSGLQAPTTRVKTKKAFTLTLATKIPAPSKSGTVNDNKDNNDINNDDNDNGKIQLKHA